jgi:hypothetical protein
MINNIITIISTAIFTITGTILLFLIFRAIVLWYWKIDTIVSLLQDISDSLSNTGEKTEQKQA